MYLGYMKTLIDLDEDLLAQAQVELGTTSKKDTVNESLRAVAERGKRAAKRVDDVHDAYYRFGVGPDIANAAVMEDARR